MKLLLENGANANLTNNEGTTPLLAASLKGHLNLVQVLLGHGVDINLANDHGANPLFAACDNGHIEVTKALLNAGANANVQRRDGLTPLFRGSSCGNCEIVELLLRNGANVSLALEDGRHAIHLASKAGHIEVVKLLLDYGSNLAVATEQFGITPLGAASCEGHIELVVMLIEKQADPKIAQNDGRQPVDQSFFTNYLVIAKLHNQFEGMEDENLSESWVEAVDAWGNIQFRLLEQGERLITIGNEQSSSSSPSFEPDERSGNERFQGRGTHPVSMASRQLIPPSTQSRALCDACRGILEKGVGRVQFDMFAGMREMLSALVGKPTKADSMPDIHERSYPFLHHLSAQSLFSFFPGPSHLQGCLGPSRCQNTTVTPRVGPRVPGFRNPQCSVHLLLSDRYSKFYPKRCIPRRKWSNQICVGCWTPCRCSQKAKSWAFPLDTFYFRTLAM